MDDFDNAIRRALHGKPKVAGSNPVQVKCVYY